MLPLPRAVLVLVPILVAVFVPGARAVAADPAVAPAAPTAPADPGLPAPTVTPVAGEAPPVAAPPPAPNAADLALKRVLRSSCSDGLNDVRTHAADPSTPWAPTVVRLCDDILLEKMQTRTRSPTGGNEGRGRLVLWSSLYGIWLGIATDILFDIDGDRAIILPPLLGMGAGLGLSLAATSNYQVTVGEAWTIITGLDYGSFNGALWAGGLDFSNKGIVGASVATSVAAASIGVLVANTKSPSAGDIEVVRSSLLWGTVGGFLLTFVVAPDVSSASGLKAVAAAMDAGLLVGVGLASSFDLSRNRVLIIDAGAIAGGLAAAGIAWLVAGTDNNVRGLAGAALGGMLGGIAITAYATRDLDAQDAARAAAPSVPAVLARDAAGRWRLGTPGPVPVFDGRGSRLIGATFNAVGGQF
jgi:hypothetical protein